MSRRTTLGEKTKISIKADTALHGYDLKITNLDNQFKSVTRRLSITVRGILTTILDKAEPKIHLELKTTETCAKFPDLKIENVHYEMAGIYFGDLTASGVIVEATADWAIKARVFPDLGPKKEKCKTSEFSDWIFEQNLKHVGKYIKWKAYKKGIEWGLIPPEHEPVPKPKPPSEDEFTGKKYGCTKCQRFKILLKVRFKVGPVGYEEFSDPYYLTVCSECCDNENC